MVWLVRHLGWSQTRFQLTSHGKTPYHFIRGKAYDGQVELFGSVCMFKVADAADLKLEDRWVKALWVGKLEKTDEHIGLTPGGVIKARSVKPKPIAEMSNV